MAQEINLFMEILKKYTSYDVPSALYVTFNHDGTPHKDLE